MAQIHERYGRIISTVFFIWWKSIGSYSSDVIERCDYRVGSIFRLRDIYSTYFTAHSDLLLIAELFLQSLCAQQDPRKVVHHESVVRGLRRSGKRDSFHHTRRHDIPSPLAQIYLPRDPIGDEPETVEYLNYSGFALSKVKMNSLLY